MTESPDLTARNPDLTPGFIQNALTAAGLLGDRRVVEADCRPVTENRGFVGETFRCSIRYEPAGEERDPLSVVVKTPSRNAGYRRLFAQFGLYRREVGFYRDLRRSTPIPTPACYASNYDSVTGDFTLLLEDLSPARAGDRAGGLTPEQAKLAVEAAARMHAHWWMDPTLTGLDWLPTPTTQHLAEPPAAAFRRVWPTFERRFGDRLPASIRELGRELRTLLPLVLERLAGPPWTLVHGDYQAGNILFSPESIAGVIDWQVTMRARGAIDVAHLVVRSLNPADRRLYQSELLETYHRGLEVAGVEGYPFEECREDYRLALISEFGLGLIMDSLLPAGPATGKADSDFESLSEIGRLRFFAALVDLDWQASLSALRRPGWGARLKSRTLGR